MKPANPHLIPFASFAVWISLTFPAKSSVFQNSVRVFPTSFPGTNYEIYAATQPEFQGAGAGLWLSVDTRRVLRPVTYTVGIGHVWYRVFDGTVIDPAFAGSATPFANAFTGNLSGQIQMTLGGSFLLGFWLDANGDSIPDTPDRFG